MEGHWIVTWLENDQTPMCKEFSSLQEMKDWKKFVFENGGRVLSLVYLERFSSGNIRFTQDYTDEISYL